MRPSFWFFILLSVILSVDGILVQQWSSHRENRTQASELQQKTVAVLGLTDLCVATEARYTRHPAVSDPVAPFMDHPGAIEHFPSGSYWKPANTIFSGR